MATHEGDSKEEDEGDSKEEELWSEIRDEDIAKDIERRWNDNLECLYPLGRVRNHEEVFNKAVRICIDVESEEAWKAIVDCDGIHPPDRASGLDVLNTYQWIHEATTHCDPLVSALEALWGERDSEGILPFSVKSRKLLADERLRIVRKYITCDDYLQAVRVMSWGESVVRSGSVKRAFDRISSEDLSELPPPPKPLSQLLALSTRLPDNFASYGVSIATQATGIPFRALSACGKTHYIKEANVHEYRASPLEYCYYCEEELIRNEKVRIEAYDGPSDVYVCDPCRVQKGIIEEQ